MCLLCVIDTRSRDDDRRDLSTRLGNKVDARRQVDERERQYGNLKPPTVKWVLLDSQPNGF